MLLVEGVSMDIVMVSSEAIPFAKTGGLADVVGTLPSRLVELGHRCSVFLPAYSRVFRAGVAVQDTHAGFVTDIGGKPKAVRLLKATYGDPPVDYYFIDQPHYFERPNLYGDQYSDYQDNCERFAFFCRSVVRAIERLSLPVDVVHCHDWQSGLVPAYMRTRMGSMEWCNHAASVMTVHNLAYQGRYWVHDMHWTGLDWKHFTMDRMEFHNDVCFLKTGITFADIVTTVSPNYAQEIQRPEFGCGLDGVLRGLGDRLVGIVNGVDYSVWDPWVDPLLPQPYGVENWITGKATCKAELQKELGLTVDPSIPVIGLVGRLAGQKGWDLVIPLIERSLSNRHVQWAILGSGEHRFQSALHELAAKAPDRVGVRLEFSDRLAHAIESGADLFLMPSQYEPCGLNQLYSLRYGTVPLVHAVGGLVDTVTDVSDYTIDDKSATGFVFYAYTLDSLAGCLDRALDILTREPLIWKQIVETGMQQDWSWAKSAIQYESIYKRACAMPRTTE